MQTILRKTGYFTEASYSEISTYHTHKIHAKNRVVILHKQHHNIPAYTHTLDTAPHRHAFNRASSSCRLSISPSTCPSAVLTPWELQQATGNQPSPVTKANVYISYTAQGDIPKAFWPQFCRVWRRPIDKNIASRCLGLQLHNKQAILLKLVFLISFTIKR